jgi:GT2 family glycosyltransferase
MYNKKVIAVIVTYNRLNLLKKAVLSIEHQTYPVEEIIIIDNDSTDGTQAFMTGYKKLNNKIVYYRLQKNTGGAGGFNFGIKKACLHKADFVWLIDDDTYSDENALKYLIETANNYRASFYCSYVIGKDKLPMNLPDIDFKESKNGYASWNQYLANGLVKVCACTFVSVLIATNTVKKVGLPIKGMFIWGDDGEYTLRLSKLANGYIVGKSIVEHKRKAQKKIKIFDETNAARIKMFFYFYRNNIFILRKYKTKVQLITFIIYSLIDAVKSLFKNRTGTFMIIIKGVLQGLFFSPMIEYIRSENKSILNK